MVSGNVALDVLDSLGRDAIPKSHIGVRRPGRIGRQNRRSTTLDRSFKTRHVDDLSSWAYWSRDHRGAISVAECLWIRWKTKINACDIGASDNYPSSVVVALGRSSTTHVYPAVTGPCAEPIFAIAWHYY